MILKGSQRAGSRQLAAHLLRTDDNEHVEVHDLRGFAADDLHGALQEAYAVSRGTKCKQFLFSLNLNPPPQESVPIEHFESAIGTIEERLGLSGQPRAIVFHEKEGRRHAHAVWSRIDGEEMKAINLPFFKSKLRDVSRDLYLKHDWQMPRGLMDSSARDPRNFDLAEWQQAKRMGWHAGDLKRMMQECWAVSDTRTAFEHDLCERGITLAKGDRRGHVAVTHEGEVLSIARYIGKKAKEVRAKLGEPDERMLSVDDAKVAIGRDMAGAAVRHIREARSQHKDAMEPLNARREGMVQHHQDERLRLDAAQNARWEEETRQRLERFNQGFRGLWDRLTGRHAQLRRENELESMRALRRDRDQRQALIDAQMEDRQRVQAEILEERQRHVEMLSELRREREHYQAMAPKPEPQPQPQPQPEKPSARDAFQRLDEFQREPPAPSVPEQDDMAARLDNLRQGHNRPDTPDLERDRD